MVSAGMTSREACIALNLLPKIGPVRVRKLIDVFGSPEGILGAPRSELKAVQGIGADIAGNISEWASVIDLDRELRRIEELGLHILTWEDEAYPPLLKEIYDPPIVLYVKGEVTSKDRHGIAIVGSRRGTHYGLAAAKKFGFQLAHAGLSVVSGLARGIDTAAHEGALAGKGRTIAVIGCGLGNLYPPENKALADRIAEGNGAVVSEFPVDYPPDKQSFPMRNRIVAGWSLGITVIEAPARSGALITASQAMDQGRNVYAVPGQIDRPTSAGSNRLIQQGAKLVMDGSEILEDLGALFPEEAQDAQDQEDAPDITLEGDELAVYEALGDSECLIDQISERSGLPASTVSATLLRLQMRRLVKQLPGNYFVKLI